MEVSKIRLSAAEMALVNDAQVILTKNSIVEKTIALLTGVQEMIALQPIAEAAYPTPPKISKGENYLGLPYVVLDYPRQANGHDLFFIRSLFWWGHFYSSTLQLSGRYKLQNLDKVIAGYSLFADNNYYAGVATDPWQHHFDNDNYKNISHLSPSGFADILQKAPHIKIAARWSLSEWDMAANHLTASWKLLMRSIT